VVYGGDEGRVGGLSWVVCKEVSVGTVESGQRIAKPLLQGFELLAQPLKAVHGSAAR
jgi:hypothetical protein